MATLVEAVTNTVLGGTSYNLTPTQPILEGDLLLIIHCQDSGTNPTIPTDFAQAIVDSIKFQGTTLSLYGAGAPTGGNALWFKIAGASEAGPYTVTAGTARNMGGTLLIIRGLNYQRGPANQNNGRFIFDSNRTLTRSGSLITHQNGPMNTVDCSYDKYLFVGAFCQNVTGATTNLSAPASDQGWALTQQGLISMVGVSQLVATAVVDLNVNPNIGTFSASTDNSGGTGRGWAVLIGDYTTATLEMADVPPPGDTLPTPSESIVSPTDGTAITDTTPLVFDVTGFGDDHFPRPEITFSDDLEPEPVHNGEEFEPLYRDHSARVAISGGYRYTILRKGGWPATPRLRLWYPLNP